MGYHKEADTKMRSNQITRKAVSYVTTGRPGAFCRAFCLDLRYPSKILCLLLGDIAATRFEVGDDPVVDGGVCGGVS